MATPPTLFQYEQTSIDGGAVVVRLIGELDIAHVESLEKEFSNLLAAKPKFVIVDLSGVQMLSSIAMGAVLRLHTALRASGGKLVVTAVPDTVLSALRRARIDLLIPVHPTVQAALDAHRAAS